MGCEGSKVCGGTHSPTVAVTEEPTGTKPPTNAVTVERKRCKDYKRKDKDACNNDESCKVKGSRCMLKTKCRNTYKKKDMKKSTEGCENDVNCKVVTKTRDNKAKTVVNYCKDA